MEGAKTDTISTIGVLHTITTNHGANDIAAGQATATPFQAFLRSILHLHCQWDEQEDDAA
jgi:hypothetical protein